MMGASFSSSFSPPLRDWERADALNVELVAYGWMQTRLIARFHLPQDRDLADTQRKANALARDVKHSKPWLCEFCGARARETNFQNLSWHHLSPPRLVIYVHFICDMDEPHVRKGLASIQRMFGMLGGGGGSGSALDAPPKSPPGVTYPLAGSCAFCERDETADVDVDGKGGESGGGGELKRCGGCRMTRYCGVACQRRDWKRHKVSCGMVCSAQFENWD